jgi:hypothetical protein
MPRKLVAAALLLVAAVPLAAADPSLDGKWLLTYGGWPGDFPVCILKADTQNGKPTFTVHFAPRDPVTVKEARLEGKELTIQLSNGRLFFGTVGEDPKQLLGCYGNDQALLPAKLVRTDKDQLAANEAIIRGEAVPPMQQAQQLQSAAAPLRLAARKVKGDEQVALLKKAEQAEQEANEKVPGLYREVIEKHAKSPAVLDATLVLIGNAARWKASPGDVARWVQLVQAQAAPHGPRFTRVTMLRVAQSLAGQKGFEQAAVAAAEPLARGLTDADPAAFQARVLSAYRNALRNAGRADDVKAVEVRLAKLEAKLDEEYLASVPPFKPAAYAGRKEKDANQVAVMELFTGAQCPPCVAADVAFDALAKAYRPTDLVLIQYHMHIPGPDPMTNLDTVARWNYYREKFPEGIRGTPSTLFNGVPQAGGGGAMANAESKFKQYRAIIDPLLEKTTAVKVGGTATRLGDKIDIAVEVSGAAPKDDNLKLRLLLVEETVKYPGRNGLRFHHQVVRALPGGAGGVAVKGAAFPHKASVDLAAVRQGLVKYLDDYAAKERPFSPPDRPLDLKQLKVIALIQDDTTREILQAVQLDVGDKTAGAPGAGR